MVLVFYKPRVLAGHLALVMHFLHAGQERETLLCTEEPMTTVEFITALFDHVNGLITNDKFCLSRTSPSRVRWARRPPQRLFVP